MRKFFGMVLVVVSAALAATACGSKGSGSGGSGGSGASGGSGGNGGTTMTTTTTTTTTTTSGTTTSSSSMTGCTGIAPAGECATCSEAACCQEIADCNGVDTCIDCVFNGGDCSDPAIQDVGSALLGCLVNNCKVCGPPPCNPVTNEPCDTANQEACDFGNYGYECYAPPNTQKLCDPCGGGNGFCEGGLSCNAPMGGTPTCAKFCCDDGDCGTGTCDFDATGDPAVGFCVDAMKASACDAPLVSPSGGSCVML